MSLYGGRGAPAAPGTRRARAHDIASSSIRNETERPLDGPDLQPSSTESRFLRLGRSGGPVLMWPLPFRRSDHAEAIRIISEPGVPSRAGGVRRDRLSERRLCRRTKLSVGWEESPAAAEKRVAAGPAVPSRCLWTSGVREGPCPLSTRTSSPRRLTFPFFLDLLGASDRDQQRRPKVVARN